MYILTRYVVWEVVKFFAAALVVLTMLFTLVMGVKVQRRAGFAAVGAVADHAAAAAGDARHHHASRHALCGEQRLWPDDRLE